MGEGTALEKVSLGRGMAQPGMEGWHTVHTHPPIADRAVHAPTVFTLVLFRRRPTAPFGLPCVHSKPDWARRLVRPFMVCTALSGV